MTPSRTRSRKKRGYPVAILIGFEPKAAVLWEIFSELVKPLETITLRKQRNHLAENELYNFHEEVVDKLRPHIKDGLRSIVVASPRNSLFTEEFLKHIQK